MRLPLVQLLLLASTTAAAQQLRKPLAVTDRPQYPFYAGAAAAVQAYQVVSPIGNIRFLNQATVGPLYLYAGYHLTPRLAVQLGFCQRSPADEGYDDAGTLTDGRAYRSYARNHKYDAAMPLLLRYRLTRRLQHRFHADALLGGTVQWHRYLREWQTTIDGQLIDNYYQYDRNTNYFLTGSLTLGVTIGQHWDLTAEAGVSTNTETMRYASVRQFLPALVCGVRYGFGKAR